ncbi:MAG TPA: hypothetical protein VLA12_01860 [Planctomycetaceae bacterium]|nr:hypothetical protein [Planctomycetaceae bacterium]
MFLSPRCFRTLVLLCVSGVAGVSSGLAQEDYDAKFYDGLRQRGLFSLAEGYLLSELSRETLLPDQRARFRLELSRTYMTHAGHRLGEEQEQLWEQAQETVNAGLNEAEGTRWYADLLLQRELIALAKARFGLQQLRLTPANTILRTETAQSLRASLASLREVENQLEQNARNVLSEYRKNSRAISPYEHRAIEKRAILEISSTLTDIAEVQYDSPELRGGPLRAATSRISVLTEGSEDETITWLAKLLEVRCSRLSGELKLAQQQLERLRERIPESLRDELIVEEARLLLAGRQPDRVAELLRDYRKTQKVLRGELSLLYLQALADLSQMARERGDSQLAAELSAQLTSDAERFRTEIGGIWGYRCSLFVELHKQAAQFGSAYAEQMRAAQNLYRSGDQQGALEAYRSLSDRAAKDGKTDLAAEMAYLAGSLELAAQEYASAGKSFLSIFERFPQSTRSAEAHLMWAYTLGKQYEQIPTRTNRESYTQALNAHLELFGTGETVGEAHLMLGQLEESRLQFTKAVPHYLQVPTSHRKAAEADLGAVRCFQKILDRLQELNQPRDARRLEAIDEISKRAARYPESEQEWSVQQSQVVLGLARLLLAQKNVDYALVDWLLTRVLRIEKQDGEWKSLRISALQLRVLALAGAGKTREAESILLQLGKTETDQLLSLMEGLNRVTSGADESVRKGIAELQLKTALELQKRIETLSEEGRKKLGVCLAEAYLAAERSREAREVYEQLVEQYPREISFREQLARLYRDCPTPDCVRRGLELWKSLEATYRQGSREWLYARKETIRSLMEIDQNTEARRLLGITELLYPELGGQELQAEFQSLKTKLGRD